MLAQPPTGDRPASARRDLTLSSVEGTSYCVMVGVGQEYFVAFALALGMGKGVSGLVATLPVMVGGILQLAAPWAILRVGSLRRYMILASATQAACFVPLLVAALLGRMPAWALFATVAAYSAINLGQGPAWSTWITTLMPRRIRARYFAARSRMLQGGVLAGLVIGGMLLSREDAGESAAIAFAPLFAIAVLMRAAGSFMLSRQSEPVKMPTQFRHVGPRELIGRARHGADVTLITFLLMSTLAMQMALPFFTPYVLEHLKFSYLEFTMLTGAAIVGKMVAAPTVGRIGHRFGPKRLLWIGAVGAVPMAPLWLAAGSFPMLLLVQFAMGLVLSCFDIGAILQQFESIPEHERPSVLATFVAFNGIAGFVGSAIGASLLGWVDLGAAGYGAAFGVASVARLLALPLLMRVRPAPPDGPGVPGGYVRVEPGAGTTEVPAVGASDD
ncbi:MAG: MFS transporter [Phycisphaeraceae bacterium]|nr:MAG: MFS transporter [Phycisphaeraceae bacterium]